VRGVQEAVIDEHEVRVRLGALGHAELPLTRIARLSKMNWPWWGGFGVRIGVRIVAFVTRPGECALIEMDEPVRVNTPFGWSTPRIAISVDDVDGFVRELAHARARADVAGPTAAQAAADPADG